MAIRILTKLKFRFRNGKDVFVSKGQNLIEDAPDWIEKDGIFELAVKDGSLVKLDTATIVQGSSPAVKETKPEPEEAVCTGWPKKLVPAVPVTLMETTLLTLAA